MKLNQIRKKGEYLIRNVNQSENNQRLKAYGIFKNAKIYYTGIDEGIYRIIISDDHLIALAQRICNEVHV